MRAILKVVNVREQKGETKAKNVSFYYKAHKYLWKEIQNKA